MKTLNPPTKTTALAALQKAGFNAELTTLGLRVWGDNWEAQFTDAGQDHDTFTGQVPALVHELAVWDDASTRENTPNPTGLIYVTVPHTMPPTAYAFYTPADFSAWLFKTNPQVDVATYDRAEWIARAEEAGEEEGSDWWNRWIVPGLALFDKGSKEITEVWYSETRNELFDAADAPSIEGAILTAIDDFNTWAVLDREAALKVVENGWPQAHKSIETTGAVAKACADLGWTTE